MNTTNGNPSLPTTQPLPQPLPQPNNRNMPNTSLAPISVSTPSAIQTNSSTETSTSHQESNQPPDFSQAIAKFKNAIIAEMDDKSKAETLVTSAINRTLGIQTKSHSAAEDDPQERTVMNALTRMIASLSRDNVKANGQPIPRLSNSEAVPVTMNGPAPERASMEIAAERAANSALTNGDVVHTQTTENITVNAMAGTKRPWENGDGNQPDAKRIASGV